MKAVVQYIIDTYNVVEEATIGVDKCLNAMLNIYGCEQNSHEAIISDIRAAFGTKVTEETYTSFDSVCKAESCCFSLAEVVDANYTASCAVWSFSWALQGLQRAKLILEAGEGIQNEQHEPGMLYGCRSAKLIAQLSQRLTLKSHVQYRYLTMAIRPMTQSFCWKYVFN